MKTLGRILIILAAFALVMGITYMVVSASSSSGTAPAFERGVDGFPARDGQRPAFANRVGPDFGHDGPRVGVWIFGLIKNVGIIGIIVALITVPKSLMRRKPLAVGAK